MAKQSINPGIIPNDDTGDTLVQGAIKINANFNEIYSKFGDGNNLSDINTSSGFQGPQGPQGITGPQGFQGFQGPGGGGQGSGFQGFQGFQGRQGNQGFQGVEGIQGPQGFQGFQGRQGFQGIQGFQGFQGVDGILGFQGFQGFQGRQGNQGFQGFQGPQGPQGIGPQGSQGPQGPQGPQGTQGFQGREGPQGFQGFQGPQGFQGVPGTSISILGSYTTVQQLPVCDGNSLGDSYIVSQNGHLYVCNGAEYVDAGYITGPQGTTGPQGFQGPQGPQGNQGNQGPVGDGQGSSQWTTTAAGIHTLSNVGIGTTNPTSKLTVTGDTSTTNLIVSGISTFNGALDVNSTSNFQGAVTLQSVLHLPSNTEHCVGDGLELRFITYGSGALYYPNTSHVRCAGGLPLYLGGGSVRITNEDGLTTRAVFTSDGVRISGVATATSFSGSGSGLTNLPAGQLTGTLPAIDGSALLNVTAVGTGIAIRDDSSNIGSATTINFGTGLDVTFASGIATITASGGGSGITDIVLDLTPQLGGNLDLNSKNITGIGTIDVTGDITGKGLKLSYNNPTSLSTPGTSGEIRKIDGAPFWYDGVEWREFFLINATAVTQVADTDWDKTILRCDFELNDDDLRFGVNPSAFGSPIATVSSSQFKFGTKSLNLTGDSSNYRYIRFGGNRPEYDFEGAWTIEGWYYFNNIMLAQTGQYTSEYRGLWSVRDSDSAENDAGIIAAEFGTVLISGQTWRMFINYTSGGQLRQQWNQEFTGDLSQLRAGFNIKESEWVHIAIQRSSTGIISIIVNGQRQGGYIENGIVNGSNYNNIVIGKSYRAGTSYGMSGNVPTTSTGGFIDDFRISTIARYSSTQNSVIPTTALPISGSTTTIIPTNSSNTFGISAETATGTNAKLRLSKSNSTQDDILLVGAGGLTIARTDDSTLTFTGGSGSSSQGPQGPQGSIGPQGPQGSIGPQGPQGSIGPQGPQGSIGPQGPQGSIGPQGNSYVAEWILGANGASDYTFTGPGLTGTENDVTLYLIRGQQYKFTNTMGMHPFRIQSTVNGSTGTQYNDGITNNDVSNGTLTWNVQFDTPSLLYYQCTAHGGMGGKIYIIDNIGGPQGPQGPIGPQGPSGSGASSRTSGTSATSSIANLASENISITAAKSYIIHKISTSAAAWVTLYTDSASRSSDATRTETTDPLPGSGVIAEVITTSGSLTQIITPGVVGWNNDGTPSSTVYAKVVNKSGSSAAITVTLNFVSLEA